VRPTWQYTQEYVQTFGGMLLIPKLLPRRREGMGPNANIIVTLVQDGLSNEAFPRDLRVHL
jgi:hypothetical protein